MVDKPVAKKPAATPQVTDKSKIATPAPARAAVAPVAKVAPVARVASVTKPVVAAAPKVAPAVVKPAAPVAAEPVVAQPTKVATPVAAKPVAAKPVVVPAPVAKPVAPVVVTPVPGAVIAPQPQPSAVAMVAAASDKGTTLMNDTLNKAQETAKTFAADAGERANAMFGDLNTRAKDAMSKGSQVVEEMVEFSKGNIEALVASGRVAAKGTEDIAKYSAEYGRKMIEEANATAKQFAAVKSPTEFFQLQSEVAKKQLDSMVAEASKFSEHYMKLLGEIAQPLQNRAAVAVEKVKSVTAA
ncbi:MAG: phasin family protein [Sphingomonadaceae bacterium]